MGYLADVLNDPMPLCGAGVAAGVANAEAGEATAAGTNPIREVFKKFRRSI